MKVWIVLFSVIVTLLLVGCGGSGGGGKKNTVERFQGPFSGTWSSSNSQNGTSSIVIQSDGSFEGTFYNATWDLNGTIEGQIVGDGSFEGIIRIGGSTYSGDGHFTLSSDELDLDGSMAYSGINFTFDFSRDSM